MQRATIAGVVVLALAVVATYVLRGTASQGPVDTGSYAVLRLAADPGARWQVPLDRIAPGLGCPVDPSDLGPRVDLCAVREAVVVGDTVVVDVQREQRAELIGAATRDGGVRWHRAAPTGSTYDCVPVTGRLWCTTEPLHYSVLKSDPGYPGLLDASERRSTTFSSSSLMELDPRTGAVLHDVPIAGSADGAVIGGIGRDGIYVVAGRTDIPHPQVRILRYTAAGTPAWSHDVTFVDGGPTQRGRPDDPPRVRVYEVDGTAYVAAAEVAGGQAIFDVGTGKPVGGGPGHVVTVTAGTVVTQRGVGSLHVGDTGVVDEVVAGFSADDRSPGEPVITTRAGSSTSLGADDISGPAKPYSIRAGSDPAPPRGLIAPDEIPLAYCDGVILAASQKGTAGYDPRTGERMWTNDASGGPDLQVRGCDGSKLVVAAGSDATAYDVRTGRRSWSVDIPQGAELIVAGLGDPDTGLVIGPTKQYEVGGATALTFVR